MPYKDLKKKKIRDTRYREENKAKIDAYNKEWREKNREKLQKRYRKYRIECLSHYSKGEMKCVCCGEDTYEFLCLDHINGGGTAHRKSLGTKGGNSFFWYLRMQGYPKGFQVLCNNCNMAKGKNGICPHQRKK